MIPNSSIYPIYTVQSEIIGHRAGRIPTNPVGRKWYVANTTMMNRRVTGYFDTQLEAMKFADTLYRKLQARTYETK